MRNDNIIVLKIKTKSVYKGVGKNFISKKEGTYKITHAI